MCGPIAVPVAMMAMTAAAAAVSAAGAYSQGKAADNAGKYQNQVARNNAILAERAAEDARNRGDLALATQASKTRQTIGSQRASGAARGVLVDSGSALDVTDTTQGIGTLDALTIRSNTEREALGYEAKGMNFLAEGRLARAAGKSAKTQGTLTAGATLLEGASDVAGQWYAMK